MDSIFIYGKTDSGKTTLLAETARYLVSLGMTGRFITADSGWGPFGDLVSPGNGVEAFDLLQYCTPSVNYKGAEPIATLNALADGFWFKWHDNQLKFIQSPPVDFYMFESLDGFAEAVMQSHVRAGRQIAEDVVGKFVLPIEITEESNKTRQVMYASGQPGRAHYGQVQRYLLTDWWPRTKGLRTKLIFVTSHEAEGKDDLDNKVLGPKVIGQASVGGVTQLFQDAFHLVQNSTLNAKTAQLESERRIYFRNHPDMISATVASQTKFWPAKVSLPIASSVDFQKRYPGGYLPFTVDEGLQDLLKLRGYSQVGVAS